MNRRSFFRLVSAGIVGLGIDPQRLWLPAPIKRRFLSISHIVAVSYEQVVRNQKQHVWADNALLRELERKGHLTRIVGGQTVEIPLDYRRNV